MTTSTSETPVPDLFQLGEPTARDLANEGMNRATEHADEVHEDWSGRAYDLLLTYARTTPEFMAEDLRVWAHKEGFPVPPDPRAWGGVVNRAVKAGMLVRDRFAMTKVPPAHSSPRAVWRSNIYREAA